MAAQSAQRRGLWRERQPPAAAPHPPRLLRKRGQPAARALPRAARGRAGAGATRLSVVGDADGADVALNLHPLRGEGRRRVSGGLRARGGAAEARLVALGVLQVVEDWQTGRHAERRASDASWRGRAAHDGAAGRPRAGATCSTRGASGCQACRKGAPLEKARTPTGTKTARGATEGRLLRSVLAAWRSILAVARGTCG
jgi:hypothetical protein